MLLALAVHRRVKNKVGILQAVRNFGRRAEHFTERGEQFFFSRAQGVRFLAQQVLKGEAVIPHLRVSRHGLQRVFGQGKDFRLCEGEGGRNPGILGRDAGIHTLGCFGAGILAVAHGSIAEKVGQCAGQRGCSFKVAVDRCGVFKLASPGRYRSGLFLKGGEGFLPGRIVGKQPA